MSRGTDCGILIAEDDDDLREDISEALRQEGYAVTGARDGARALLSVLQRRPTLVLLDMKMPYVDGWKFAQDLNSYGVQVPIVVMTASDEAPQAADQIGAADWIGKPFHLDQLLSVVKRNC